MPKKKINKNLPRIQKKSSEIIANLYDDEDDNSKPIGLIEDKYKQILEMQNKILSAPAMNGGFTTLLYKVENIEQSQEKLVEKIDQIHNVLYEPDTGLYARLKIIENDCASNETIDNIEKDLQEIKIWKSSEEKQSEKEDVKDDINNKIILEHDSSIKEVQNYIKKYNSIAKWILLTFGGGILSLAGKLIYEYVKGHIKFV